MAEDHIRYDILAADALRGMVKKVLSEVAKAGLPGDHHFYITFTTKAPGVRISSRLLNQYPGDMTIVLQHQFWDMTVSEHALEVGLSFNGIPERLLIPFSALKAFVDPSVPFSVGFEPMVAPEEEAAEPAAQIEPRKTESGAPTAIAARPRPAREAVDEEVSEEPKAAGDAQVVSLDAFRKKN